MLAAKIDHILSSWMEQKDSFQSHDDKDVEYIGSETIGEIIEKLMILNIRIWVLEDTAAQYKKEGNEHLYSQTKMKLDACFKIKRPQLVAALDKVFGTFAPGNAFAPSINIKQYKNEV